MTRAPAEFFDRDIEPKALCRNCEYFDGGGLDVKGNPREFHGDCHNSLSDRFTTTADETCIKFWPCTTRWPDFED